MGALSQLLLTQLLTQATDNSVCSYGADIVEKSLKDSGDSESKCGLSCREASHIEPNVTPSDKKQTVKEIDVTDISGYFHWRSMLYCIVT